MGVYINMEMPENCALCPMWDAGNCLTASEAIICEYDKRPQDCPLVHVPPHGRLVDADEIKTAFPCGESVRTECVRATIDNAPTVLEAEEGE